MRKKHSSNLTQDNAGLLFRPEHVGAEGAGNGRGRRSWERTGWKELGKDGVEGAGNGRGRRSWERTGQKELGADGVEGAGTAGEPRWAGLRRVAATPESVRFGREVTLSPDAIRNTRRIFCWPGSLGSRGPHGERTARTVRVRGCAEPAGAMPRLALSDQGEWAGRGRGTVESTRVGDSRRACRGGPIRTPPPCPEQGPAPAGARPRSRRDAVAIRPGDSTLERGRQRAASHLPRGGLSIPPESGPQPSESEAGGLDVDSGYAGVPYGHRRCQRTLTGIAGSRQPGQPAAPERWGCSREGWRGPSLEVAGGGQAAL